MIAPGEAYADITREALAHFRLPESYGALLIGSLAEGFGNELSDVDILVINPTAADFKTFRQFSWIGERRAEIFFRSMDELAELADFVNSLPTDQYHGELQRGGSGVGGGNVFEAIDFYHRVCSGYVIAGEHVVEEALRPFSKARLVRAKSFCDLQQAHDAASLASAYAKLGLDRQAAQSARMALLWSASYWASCRGETYGNKKFLLDKLHRAQMPAPEIDLVHAAIYYEHAADGDAVAYLLGVASQLTETPFRDDTWCFSPTRKLRYVEARNNRWLATASDVFVLDDLAAPIGKRLEEGPIPLAEAGGGLEILVALLREGVVDLRSDRGVNVHVPARHDHEPAAYRITWAGVTVVHRGDDRPAVVKIPLSLQALVQSILEIIRCGWRISGLREDAIGSIRAQRWWQLEYQVRVTVDHVARTALASSAEYPLPADEWVRDALSTDPSNHDLIERIDQVWAVRITDPSSAEQAIALADAICDCLPRDVFGDLSSSHSSFTGGLKWIDAQQSWGRLANDLDINLSIAPAEFQAVFDTFADSGGLALDRMAEWNFNTKLHEMFLWHRADDLKNEVARLL